MLIRFRLCCTTFSCFQLKDYRSLYEGYVPMKYKRYYKKISKYVKLFWVMSSVT